MTDELVQERTGHATDDRAGEVDPDLTPVLALADDRLEDLRANLAGRVQGGSGDRTDENDDPVDDEADDDPGEPGWSPAVDCRAEDGEDEDAGPDHVREEPDDIAGAR